MIGARPFTDDECTKILANCPSLRMKCLFVLGVKTGFRISELLSLTIKEASDAVKYKRLKVQRCNMKGETSSRSVPLGDAAHGALEAYLIARCEEYHAHPDGYSTLARLFPFGRMHAHRLLKEAVHAAGLTGSYSTHSMRKTFARRVYHALGKDLVNTQRALGHASVSSTVKYLSFDQEAIDKAIIGE